MKLKNAPERKRQRQLGALDRLMERQGRLLAAGFTPDNDRERFARIDAEIDILDARTINNLRHVRTKKDRSGSAPVVRG